MAIWKFGRSDLLESPSVTQLVLCKVTRQMNRFLSRLFCKWWQRVHVEFLRGSWVYLMVKGLFINYIHCLVIETCEYLVKIYDMAILKNGLNLQFHIYNDFTLKIFMGLGMMRLPLWAIQIGHSKATWPGRAAWLPRTDVAKIRFFGVILLHSLFYPQVAALNQRYQMVVV